MKSMTSRAARLHVAVYLAVTLSAGFGCRGEEPPPDPGEPEPAEAAEAPTQETPKAPAASTATRPEEAETPEVAAAAERPSRGEEQPEAPLHLVRHRGDPAGPIGYLVVEPAEGAADLPLLIALHGRGDRPDAFAALVEQLRLPVRGVVARGPQAWGMRAGRQWFELGADDADAQVLQRVDDLVALADRLRREYPGAPKPILLGFSQGAMLALQAVARRPELFGGAVALSGYLPVAEGNETATEPVPVLMTVGERDRVVPPERTLATVDALKALGHDPEVVRFRGGHMVPKDVLARIREFLEERIP